MPQAISLAAMWMASWEYGECSAKRCRRRALASAGRWMMRRISGQIVRASRGICVRRGNHQESGRIAATD